MALSPNTRPSCVSLSIKASVFSHGSFARCWVAPNTTGWKDVWSSPAFVPTNGLGDLFFHTSAVMMGPHNGWVTQDLFAPPKSLAPHTCCTWSGVAPMIESPQKNHAKASCGAEIQNSPHNKTVGLWLGHPCFFFSRKILLGRASLIRSHRALHHSNRRIDERCLCFFLGSYTFFLKIPRSGWHILEKFYQKTTCNKQSKVSGFFQQIDLMVTTPLFFLVGPKPSSPPGAPHP